MTILTGGATPKTPIIYMAKQVIETDTEIEYILHYRGKSFRKALDMMNLVKDKGKICYLCSEIFLDTNEEK